MTVQTAASAALPEGVEILPVAGRIGAELRGFRLGGGLRPDEVAAIRGALLRYKVIFFRGQAHLDETTQEAFASLLGPPVKHPTLPTVNNSRFVLDVDSMHAGRANNWHTDVTFTQAYPMASILRAVVVPPFGGDTLWAHTVTAYQDLPRELRDLADRLHAEHSNARNYLTTRGNVAQEETLGKETSPEALERARAFSSKTYTTEHPVVRVHPETGERGLVMGEFVQRLCGLSPVDSAHLKEVFQGHIMRPENTVRWRWQAGDVAIWDNRATQHYAIDDYGDQRRIMRRVTISGDVPVGVDGWRSVTKTAA
jgi:taurine dioxygenase